MVQLHKIENFLFMFISVHLYLILLSIGSHPEYVCDRVHYKSMV